MKNSAKVSNVKDLLDTLNVHGRLFSITYTSNSGVKTHTVRTGVAAHLIERPTAEDVAKAKSDSEAFAIKNPYILRAWSQTVDREGRAACKEDGTVWDGAKAYRSFKMENILSANIKKMSITFKEIGDIPTITFENKGSEWLVTILGLSGETIAIPEGKAKLSTRSDKVRQEWLTHAGISLYYAEFSKTDAYTVIDDKEKALKLAATKCSFCKKVCGAEHHKVGRKVACNACYPDHKEA
ncbi:hypothetical protein KAR91_38710 [Candidatus Pacearchaeota archaeon]|nr:hypothetical protein [Candidatus Pacearchaeota archaeon]